MRRDESLVRRVRLDAHGEKMDIPVSHPWHLGKKKERITSRDVHSTRMSFRNLGRGPSRARWNEASAGSIEGLRSVYNLSGLRYCGRVKMITDNVRFFLHSARPFRKLRIHFNPRSRYVIRFFFFFFNISFPFYFFLTLDRSCLMFPRVEMDRRDWFT